MFTASSALAANVNFSIGSNKLQLKPVAAENCDDNCGAAAYTTTINGKQLLYTKSYVEANSLTDNKYIFTGDKGSFRVYKTSQPNIVAINYSYSEMDTRFVWKYINIKTQEVKTYFVLRNSYLCSKDNNLLGLGDEYGLDSPIFYVTDAIDAKNCVDGEVMSQKTASAATPIFLGFDLVSADGASLPLYKAVNNSPLRCVYGYDRMGAVYHQAACETVKKLLGIGQDLYTVYFSATGKGWTAYYAYDIKAKKIAKVTLAAVNKNIIHLTQVKKF